MKIRDRRGGGRVAAALRRPGATRHPAAADCERIRPRGLAQPANAVSSLAYAAAGSWLLRRRRRATDRGALLAYVAALLADGAGGLAFHGRGDRLSRWLHDAALAATLALIANEELVRRRAGVFGARSRACGASVDGPRATGRLTNVVRRAPLETAALLAGTVVYHRSRIGRPWCRPDSWLQGHAGWHLLTAVALAGWGERTLLQPRSR